RIGAQYGASLPPELSVPVEKTSPGSCWSCPVGAKRTAAPVWGDKACGPQPIGLVPARYVQPGLFRLDGGEAVALALARDGALVESIAGALAEILNEPESTFLAKTWQEIAATPAYSVVLLAAVYSRVVAAVADPDHATDAEKRLAKSFADAIRTYH